MDRDIAFLKRLQSVVPIAAWNLGALVVSAVFLSSGFKYWKLAVLTLVIAIAGNYIWFRWRTAHSDRPCRFLNLEVLQIAGYAIALVGFSVSAVVDKQPRLFIVAGVSWLLLGLRLKVRADRQALISRQSAPSQLN
ncbi:hypothetical protein [Terriglobus roseus]|uniref:Uncharacterized protein n=1 Tax=Terriglobus roseus TaxID=392734 RepID=A0A1G7IKM3_9BACT|nr:hypothetical protein [Terriglobus roseus]SDF13155.1 hypothetical protein SAMN05444167_1483 [Terriglobus roseus]